LIVHSFTRAGAVAILLGAGVSCFSASANAACRSIVAATGGANSFQYLASASSKYAWKDKVSGRYGAKYSTWSNAKSKNVDCSKSGPNKKWVCTASGRPCD
jgi:hypothetical protein